MSVNKSRLLYKTKGVLLILLGTVLLAFSTAVFIIPFNLVVGGMSGYAIVMTKLFDLTLPTDTLIAIISWSVFLLGLIFLGKTFAMKTLISSIVYPVMLSLFSRLVSPDILRGTFYLTGSSYSEISIILAAVFGGIISGAGCAITFLGNGSTGGVDIIAFIICKYFKRLKSSRVIFAIDTLAVLTGLFAFNDLVLSLLGLTAAAVSAVAIDKIFLGSSSAFIAQIISNEPQKINSLVASKIERTTSLVEIKGGYSGSKKTMLIVSFTKNQYSDLTDIISSVDPSAFVTIHKAHQINGEGWM